MLGLSPATEQANAGMADPLLRAHYKAYYKAHYKFTEVMSTRWLTMA